MKNIKSSQTKGVIKMQITYTKQGDYYLPDLVLPKTQNKANLGKYAILRLNYLKQKINV